MRNDLSTRQAIAGWTLGIMAAGVPILIGAALLFITAWLASLKTIGLIHIDDIHATLWGWLTDWSYRKDARGVTHRIHDPNTIPLAWFMAWVTAWFVYEAGEGFWALIRGFARLARRDRREEALQGEVIDP